MPAYHIVGGRISPNCVIIARSEKEARERHAEWCGMNDRWIGVYKLDNGTVIHENNFYQRNLSAEELRAWAKRMGSPNPLAWGRGK